MVFSVLTWGSTLDGLGSTRALTDETGAVTDTYDYTVYGEMAFQAGATLNSYLYAGEQYDEGLEQYYLRARYYDQSIGRFTQMDTFEGWGASPITLNKYTYGNADPANHTDPSGNFSLGGQMAALSVSSVLVTAATSSYMGSFGSVADYDPLEVNYKTAGILIIMAASSPNSLLLNLVDAKDTNYDYGDEGCVLIYGPVPSSFEAYSEVTYSCKPFKSWRIRRYVPTVIASAVPKTAPCAPGFPYDMMPAPLSQGVNSWRECHYRN